MVGRALVVEDELNIASLIVEIMQLCDVEVVKAARASEALERLSSENVNFAMIDISLPDANGVELYEQIAASHPELNGRVIFMSGYNPDWKLERLLERTGNRFIQKPFQVEELREIIKQMI